VSSKRRKPQAPKPEAPATVRRVTALQLAPSEWGVCSGYGRAAFSISNAFKELGIARGVIGKPKLVGDGPELPVLTEDAGEVVLHIGEPPTWKLVTGARNIGFCWWPFSKMPTEWFRPLFGIERLIVPSEWNARSAILPQPHQTVHIAPLGLHSETFEPCKRERGENLRFLFFDGDAGSYRAGGDIAVAAFLKAFPEKRKDVSLDVWSTHQTDLATPDERIQLRRHIGSDADLVRLYRRYDALLATARGAGFGLVPIEAMATGMPVFHAGQGGYGHLSELGVLVGAHKRSTVASAHASAECFEPLYEITGTRMMQMDLAYDAFRDHALDGAETVRERFTWAKTAHAILAALD
jgi:glycosyltransferase involved in cell wall biosynthesis